MTGKKRKSNPETVIAIGQTDGFRYIAVKPPLDTKEIDALRAKRIVSDAVSIGLIDEFSPACSMFCAADDLSGLDIMGKTAKAQEVAKDMARVLRTLREGPVSAVLAPVALLGHNSSPFNPNTDALRHR